MELDDKSFIELAKRDKERAFSLLIDAYSSKVFNTCVNLLRNVEDAEDVTQEVFVSVFQSLDKFEGRSKLSTWIYSVSLNKSKEFLRSKTRKKRFGIFTVLDKNDSHMLPSGAINFNHPGVILEDQERAKILFQAIDQLSDNQKTAYVAHKIEGMSYQEVSKLLDLSISSVESLMFRAKKRLKELLEEYYIKNEL